MAKQLVGNGANSYTFTASAKTVRITGITPLAVGQILLINNATRETIIYNPFVSGKGYTAFSNGLLTLEYDTTAMADGDVLQIFYDNSDQALVAIADMSLEIRNLANLIASPSYADGTGGIRVTTVTTVSSVSSVGAITSLQSLNTLNSVPMTLALTDPLLNLGFSLIRDRIAVS